MSTTTHDDKRELSIEDIGPITKLRLFVPPGKITVLNGPNGAGKTQALEAVAAAQRGVTRLSNRDGTTRGRASFGGVTIKVGRGGTNRRSGDLEVESLEDRLSIASLVDPGLKDANAADAARIKALVLLAGGAADVTKFHVLTDGDQSAFSAIVSPEAGDADDIVRMASRIKRDFDAAARKVEADLEHVVRQRDGKLEAVRGTEVDLDAPHDSEELERDRDGARDQFVLLKERREAGLSAQHRAADARRKLAGYEDSYDGPTVAESKRRVYQAASAWNAQRSEVDRLEHEIVGARENSESLKREYSTESDLLAVAEGREDVVAEWREIIEAGLDAVPDESAVSRAEEALRDATSAVQDGVLIRDALARKVEAEALGDQARLLEAKAEGLRDAGRGTEEVLSNIVGELGVPLKVDKEFRLLANHPNRGWCYFAELSMGEKWRIGLDTAIANAGGPSLLAIPQEAFESLDRINRQAIAERIAGTDVAILTAEAQQWQECPECGGWVPLGEVKCECGTDMPVAELTVSTYE